MILIDSDYDFIDLLFSDLEAILHHQQQKGIPAHQKEFVYVNTQCSTNDERGPKNTDMEVFGQPKLHNGEKAHNMPYLPKKSLSFERLQRSVENLAAKVVGLGFWGLGFLGLGFLGLGIFGLGILRLRFWAWDFGLGIFGLGILRLDFVI